MPLDRLRPLGLSPLVCEPVLPVLQDGQALRRRLHQRDQAVQLVIGKMGVERDRAETIVDQALIVTGSPQAASPQGKQTAERAMQAAGTAAWVIFLAVALALAIGIGGGVLGAAGSRRVNWSGAVPQA